MIPSPNGIRVRKRTHLSK